MIRLVDYLEDTLRRALEEPEGVACLTSVVLLISDSFPYGCRPFARIF